LLLVVLARPAAAQIEESNLPPPAAVSVDFARDIKPILAASCIRCHGAENPRSHFSLSSRASVLKGGDEGVDVLPGRSAESPLVHYVAQLTPGLEMPPIDKGKPLTPAQIGLLRAWIDQGAAWETNRPADSLAYAVSPVLGGTGVRGDAAKFREQTWQKDGVNGGLAQFDLVEHPRADSGLALSGHALADDYKLDLSLRKNDLGFINSGWQQYRKYYDGTGGDDPLLHASTPSPEQNLHLDIGKGWVDFGLTLPNWPRMVLGFEQDYKDGAEATTDWDAAMPGSPRNTAPAGKSLHEEVNVIKFDLDDEVKGVTIEEQFRGEFYNLNTHYTNLDARQPVRENAQEGDSYFQGANTLRFEKKFNDWLFGSAGYLYSKLNSDASFTDAANNPSFGTTYVAIVPQVSLEKQSHVFNVNGLLGPFDGLTISTGVESEWTQQHGFGGDNVMLNPIYTNGSAPTPGSGPLVLSALSSDYDETSVTESVGLRYGRVPYSILFADARLQQQSIGQSDYDLQPVTDFAERTAFSSQLTDLRAGFNTSPWRSVSLSAHYRRYEDDSQYQNELMTRSPSGYPGFIKERDLLTDEAEAKLTLRPSAWFKTTLTYQYLTSDYTTVTGAAAHRVSPGGDILAGQSVSQVYSVNATITPRPSLYLSATFSYQPTTSVSAANGAPTVTPYRGDIYSVIANATYALNRNADLFVNYSFSEADYAEANYSAGLPLGIEYQQHVVGAGVARRFGINVTAKLQYAFYSYEEPSSGGADNFTANSIFATLTFRGP
jgi:hypothetical protein